VASARTSAPTGSPPAAPPLAPGPGEPLAATDSSAGASSRDHGSRAGIGSLSIPAGEDVIRDSSGLGSRPTAAAAAAPPSTSQAQGKLPHHVHAPHAPAMLSPSSALPATVQGTAEGRGRAAAGSWSKTSGCAGGGGAGGPDVPSRGSGAGNGCGSRSGRGQEGAGQEDSLPAHTPQAGMSRVWWGPPQLPTMQPWLGGSLLCKGLCILRRGVRQLVSKLLHRPDGRPPSVHGLEAITVVSGLATVIPVLRRSSFCLLYS
jgi:hypothetical protein